MQKNVTGEELRITKENNPELYDSINRAVYDNASTWSIGKLRAFCEKNGIRAAKLKRKQLLFHVEQLIEKETEAIIYQRLEKGRYDNENVIAHLEEEEDED